MAFTFFEKGVKTVAKNYQKYILTNVVATQIKLCFKVDHGCFYRSLYLFIRSK